MEHRPDQPNEQAKPQMQQGSAAPTPAGTGRANPPPNPRLDATPASARETKAQAERVPAPVLAALVTGAFALLTTLVTTYFPSRVNLEQVRLQATQTAESRYVQSTLDALAPGAAGQGTADATRLTATPPPPGQALPAGEAATGTAEAIGTTAAGAPTATITPTATSTPTATKTPTPKKGSHPPKRGDEGPQK